MTQQQKKIMLPFCPFPFKAMKAASQKFLGAGEALARAFPYLDLHLKQAGMSVKKEEYGAIMFLMMAFYFALISLLFYAIALRFVPAQAIIMSLTVGGIAAFLVLVQLSAYPAILVKKKVREIEKNLVFALRTMLIEIKSGVSLFDALTVISQGNYGALSAEFKQAVEEIETGTPEEDALQKLATQNPSLFFRKAVWQLVNGMKAGADVTALMQELVGTMGKEQKIEINRYGGALRLLSLVYMMMGVIVPAMGLTLLIVLSSFPQIKVVPEMFWALLGFVVLMQFMYLGLMKSKRPNIIG